MKIIFNNLLMFFLFTTANVQSQKLIIGNNVWPGCGLMYLAESKGFFKEAGLDVEMRMYDDYIESIKAFKRGEIDIIQEDIFSCIYTALEGVAYTAVIPTVDNLGFDELMSQTDIKSVFELKGKKVAYSPGSVGHFLLLKALEINGLSENDIIPVSAGFKEVEKLFNEKEIDCGVCHFYNRPSGNVLYSTRDYDLPNLLMVRQDKYEKQYEDIKKIIEVWQRAIKFFNENEEESLLIMQEELKIDNNKLWISLMKRAPIIDLKEDAEKLYGDNGSIYLKINDILSFIEQNKDTEESIRQKCSIFKTQIREIFNNSLLKSFNYFQENQIEYTSRMGVDYAFFFANDNYDDIKWKNLKNPSKDARSLADILNKKYGFITELYIDLSLDSISCIMKKISTKKYNTGDQLFLFFAGHGYFDEDEKEGYIVVKNSSYGDLSNKTYYSFSKLVSQLDKISCSHILLVLDVCFSGTIFKEIALSKGSVYSDSYYLHENNVFDYQLINKTLKIKTRKALTAGGKIEVSDGIKHSPFAFRLIEALNYGADETRILTINALKSFCETQYPYPKLEDFAPNETGGDFLFILK